MRRRFLFIALPAFLPFFPLVPLWAASKDGTLAWRRNRSAAPLDDEPLPNRGLSALVVGIAIITVIILALLERAGYLLLLLGFGLPFLLVLLAAYFIWSYRRSSEDSARSLKS